MSVKHIGLVLDHLSAPPATKLVAIVLADHADVDGLCWPSYRRIAQRTGLGERYVRRQIKILIEMGVLTKVRTGTIHKDGDKVSRITNAYRVRADVLAKMPSNLSTEPADEVGLETPLEVGLGVPDRWAYRPTKPSLNHQIKTGGKVEKSVENSEPPLTDPVAIGELMDRLKSQYGLRHGRSA